MFKGNNKDIGTTPSNLAGLEAIVNGWTSEWHTHTHTHNTHTHTHTHTHTRTHRAKILGLQWDKSNGTFPAGNYMFKANIKNSRTRCEICSNVTLKTPKRRQFLLLTLNI